MSFQGRSWGSGAGRSKKEAEQRAAADAFTALQGAPAGPIGTVAATQGVSEECSDRAGSHADASELPSDGGAAV